MPVDPRKDGGAFGRMTLGLAQMVAALTTAILLLQSGVNWLTMTVITVTFAPVGLSSWLYRGR